MNMPCFIRQFIRRFTNIRADNGARYKPELSASVKSVKYIERARDKKETFKALRDPASPRSFPSLGLAFFYSLGKKPDSCSEMSPEARVSQCALGVTRNWGYRPSARLPASLWKKWNIRHFHFAHPLEGDLFRPKIFSPLYFYLSFATASPTLKLVS